MGVKELRGITGLTQAQFAEKYHISLRQLQSWECGFRNTPDCILYMLGRLVSIDYKVEVS